MPLHKGPRDLSDSEEEDVKRNVTSDEEKDNEDADSSDIGSDEGEDGDVDENGEEGDLGEQVEFRCDGCSEGIYPQDTRFHCSTCGDFDLCEGCFFDEENESTHEHPLIEIKEGKVLFAHKDEQTGNTLFLSDFRAVLPSSNIIKNHAVRSVLSAVDFHPNNNNCNKDLDLLQTIYHPTNSQKIPPSTTTSQKGVVYHHVNMPDLQKPSLLSQYGLTSVLEEASAFLDCAMARGNTIVHCERGQFRSPTLILAWLITRGMTTDAAIAHIAEDYEGWGKKYTNSRPEWVARLKAWEKDFKKDRQTWGSKNHARIQLWKAQYQMIGNHTTTSTTSTTSTSSTSASSHTTTPTGDKRKADETSSPLKKQKS